MNIIIGAFFVGLGTGIIVGFCLLACLFASMSGDAREIINKSPEG